MAKPARNRSKAPVVRRVPAVSRATAILKFLAAEGEPIGVVPLAREVGLIPSTCLHILRALTEDGLVTFNPDTKRYALGPGVLAFAAAFAQRDPFIQAIQPRLDDLARRHGCGFAAVEEGRDHCVVVAIADAETGFSVRVKVGMRFPKLVSATGRCLVAFGAKQWTNAELKESFSELPWEKPPAFKDWLASIETTKKQGHAVDDGNFIKGLTVVTVPVFADAGAIAGFISAVALRERINKEALTALTRDIQMAAQSASRELGHDKSPNRTRPSS